MMNPVVTGIAAPGALVTAHRPCPNRTGPAPLTGQSSFDEVEAGD